MNRKERRANLKRGGSPARLGQSEAWDKAFTTEDLLAKARSHYQQRQPELARNIAERILAREPSHVPALNLLGLIYQEAGHHRLAVKTLTKAVSLDALNAACHYNLATSHQALGRREDAAVHFKRAIALGMSRKNVEHFIFQNPAITACISRIDQTWPFPVKVGEILGRQSLEKIANDVLLRSALETVLLRTEPLEKFLTALRSALLAIAYSRIHGAAIEDGTLALFCALAQQCFINEYVFAQSDEDARCSSELRDALLREAADEGDIPPLLVAAVAAYFPLHRLAGAHALLNRKWPQSVASLVRQQVQEPAEEADDLSAIPVLTAVEDRVSLEVMRQYEENPYPRWTINLFAAVADEFETPVANAGDDQTAKAILVAGCGTGQHAFQIAHYFPGAHVLAVDISLPSLAYARRKSREEDLRNVEYAQADILKLDTVGRSFDRIEAVGVLHHFADPELGWRVLLSLLRPNGVMRVGLYSEAGRRGIVEVRAFIAERDYHPTAEDIRKCRQEMLRDADKRRWNIVVGFTDFYSMSGCRDMLFNVMEHRFTIPRIKAFLNQEGLSFQGFELEPKVLEKFQTQFPADAALTDLDKWHAFEADNPQTFRNMYVFTVRKD
jgi:SAM-dependent methyltransferase